MNPRIAPILMLLLAGALAPTNAHGAESIDEEKAAKVKAAYVLNFIKFTRWPDGAFEDQESPLVIAIVGPEALRPILEQTVVGKAYEGREIRIRRFSLPRPEGYDRKDRYRGAVKKLREQLLSAHVVYFSDHSAKDAGGYLNAIRSEPILSLGETRACAERGVMLALGIDRGRIVFYANTAATEAAPLAISSKLLRLARVIEPQQ